MTDPSYIGEWVSPIQRGIVTADSISFAPLDSAQISPDLSFAPPNPHHIGLINEGFRSIVAKLSEGSVRTEES